MTSTKTDASVVSLEEIKKICDTVSIPVVAIGGIKENNIMNLKGTNVDGVAIVSAIFGAENIREASYNLLETVNRMKEK